MSKTKSDTFGVTLSTEIGASFEGLFDTKVGVSSTFETTSSETWNTESTVTDTFSIDKGDTVVVWQYVYNGVYADQIIPFKSDIFGYTNNLNQPPTD